MISEDERERYVLKESRDEHILELVHELEALDLSPYEMFLLALTRSQLEADWRKPLLQILELIRKHADKPAEERMRIVREFAKKNFL